MSNERLLLEFNNLRDKYNGTVTELSKSDNGYFIRDDTRLISGDEFKNNIFKDNNYASVDAIDYYLEKGKLIINFFEFKNMNLDNEDNSKKTDLIKLINNMNLSCPECSECTFYDSLKMICNSLPNDKMEQIKSKAFESLVMLYLYLGEKYYKELHEAEKRFFVVSHVNNVYPRESPNVSNTNRRGTLRVRFDFLFKIQPFPYIVAQSIDEGTFKNLISRENS